MNDISISGAIGSSFLKKDNKKIIIFYDDHSNTKYCDSSYFIDNFFSDVNSQINGSIILLEEPLVNNDDNIIFLWNDIPHVVKSKEFYKKITNKCSGEKVCRVFPIDIRLCLIDISIEEYLPGNTTDQIEKDIQLILDLQNIEKIMAEDLKKMKKIENMDIDEIIDDIDKKINADETTQNNKRFAILKDKKHNVRKNNRHNNTTEIHNEDEDETVGNYFQYFIYLFDCGKIDTKKFKENSKIILFTERVNILQDMFDFTKNNITPNKKKIQHWKNIGVGDLTHFKIINCVTKKDRNWYTYLNNNGPVLIVINRAYLTSSKYTSINNLSLILHDECHNTTSDKCNKFLTNFYQKNIPIVGFSATPVRTGRNDLAELNKIYGINNSLNLLTNYNLIYAISEKLVLPPEFYWYHIDIMNK